MLLKKSTTRSAMSQSSVSSERCAMTRPRAVSSLLKVARSRSYFSCVLPCSERRRKETTRPRRAPSSAMGHHPLGTRPSLHPPHDALSQGIAQAGWILSCWRRAEAVEPIEAEESLVAMPMVAERV